MHKVMMQSSSMSLLPDELMSVLELNKPMVVLLSI
jgi:hypothetical protein